MAVKLIWSTPDADKLVAYIARVSNPKNQNNHDTALKLIKYMLDHRHNSPFEMVSACFEIETTRMIGRQILRHRSFSFQEFSQRYAEVPETFQTTPARLQDTKNRQNSIIVNDEYLSLWWQQEQNAVIAKALESYQQALKKGIAKEVARSVLPEITTTKMYMAGTARSWIHYLRLRCAEDTQKEHRDIANQIKDQLHGVWPIIMDAAFGQQS